MKFFKISVLLLFCACSHVLSAQKFDKVSISNVSAINTATYDFSPAFYKDGIVFVSNNDIKDVKKMFDKKINEKAMSLFIARNNENGELSKPQLFARELVSSVHEGPLTFEKDYKTAYISRNNNKILSGKAKYASNYVDYMKIYVTKSGEKGWSKPKAMSLNERKSDACHPALSPDGSKLYFSSNRAGGFGGMDLYVCEKKGNKWGKPMNLGAKINSNKNDVFPYVHNDGTLYFSSDREGGKGGLDIYYYENDRTNTNATLNYYTGTPLSIGEPFNSENDDFGFIITPENNKGYFTSNRSGGVGGDDIYTFDTTLKEEKPLRTITIKVFDSKTNMPIPNAEIVAINAKNNSNTDAPNNSKNTPLNTDNKGNAILNVKPTDNYAIGIKSNGYKPEKLTYSKDETRNEIIVLLEKEAIPAPVIVEKPIEKPVERPVTDDVKPMVAPVVAAPTAPTKPELAVTVPVKESVFKLRNIHYNFDDSNIRYDASVILDSLATILKENPDMYIELAAHTDSKGSDRYNDLLSERRANKAAEYLAQKGIDPKRLIQVAFGKRKLLIEDTGKAVVTGSKNQLNRRTEIRVIKVEN